MSTAARRKGAGFELDLMRWFRALGFDTERLRLSGKLDEGDLRVLDDDRKIVYVIEAKAEAKIDLPGYLREAAEEGKNYTKARDLQHSAWRVATLVVVKARGKGIADAYVVQRLGDMFT